MTRPMIPLLLLILLGGASYLIWMGVTAWNRRWRKLIYQFLAAIGIMGGLYGGAVLWWRWQSAREEAAFFEGLAGVPGHFPDSLFAYTPPRDFNGDGYSVEVFPLPAEIRARFEHFDAAKMAGFPKRPEYRAHWQRVDWQATPLKPEDKQYLDFVLPGAEEAKEQCARIRELLGKPGSFYGYFYFSHEGWLGDVDFFIVDREGGRLYLLNLNT